jgi:hypothetical protein
VFRLCLPKHWHACSVIITGINLEIAQSNLLFLFLFLQAVSRTKSLIESIEGVRIWEIGPVNLLNSQPDFLIKSPQFACAGVDGWDLEICPVWYV